MFGSQHSYSEDAGRLTAVQWLLIITGVAFLLQNICMEMVHADRVLSAITLWGDSLITGKIWTLFSYTLLQSGLLGLIVSLLGIYFIGKPLEMILGSQRLMIIYWTSAALGALAWTGLHFGTSHQLIGAAPAILGLLMYFCCLNPEQPITLLLFFILPITIKPKWLAWSIIGLELFGLVFDEILGPNISTSTNSAHLGGILAGLLCFLYYEQSPKIGWGSNIQKPLWSLFKRPTTLQPNFHVNLSQRTALKMELDRILDKINTHGFGSLTAAEKETLAHAKDLLNH